MGFCRERRQTEQFHRLRKRRSKDEDKDKEDSSDDDLLEKMFIHDIVREIISNGTAEYRTCKIESADTDEEIFSVAEQIFGMEVVMDEVGIFYSKCY